MFDTKGYICETCTHEPVCKYAKEMKDLEDALAELNDMLAVSDLKDFKDMAAVKVTCRNRTLQGYMAKTSTARATTANQVMAENYGD